MNPVKWVIFLISLFFVTGSWFTAFNKVFPKGVFATLLGIMTIVEFCLLSYMLPYSIWWLMHIWRW